MDKIVDRDIDNATTTNILFNEDNYHYNENCYTANTTATTSSHDDTILSVVVGGKSNKRPRKARSIFTVEQLKILNDEFERHNYINNYTREDLALKAGITPEQVKIWFQNMRSKRRKCNERAKQNLMGFNFLPPHTDITANIHQQSTLSNVYTNTQPYYFHNNNMYPNYTTNNINGSSSSSSSSNYINLSNPRVDNNYTLTTNTINNNGNKLNNSTNWSINSKNNHYKHDRNNFYITPTNPNIPHVFTQQPPIYSKDNTQQSNNTTTNNKPSTFIAPGFATTLYNAKLSNELNNKTTTKVNQQPNQISIMNNTKLLPTTTTNTSFLNNRSNDNEISSTKNYSTSTPHKNHHYHFNSTNSNTFYNSCLPPFFGSKSKMNSMKNPTMPTIQKILPTTNIESSSGGGGGIRPNH